MGHDGSKHVNNILSTFEGIQGDPAIFQFEPQGWLRLNDFGGLHLILGANGGSFHGWIIRKLGPSDYHHCCCLNHPSFSHPPESQTNAVSNLHRGGFMYITIFVS